MFDALVRTAAIVLGALLASAIVVLFAHAFWLEWRERRDAARIERGKQVVYALLRPGLAVAGDRDAEAAQEADVQWLRRQPMRVRKALLLPLARNLHADGEGPIARLAREIGLTDHAEALSCSRWWWRRLEGARLLAVLGGGDDTMPRLLQDPHPIVRARAADWAATHPAPHVVAMLLDRVNEPQAFSRFAVQDALVRMGSLATAHVARYLEHHEGSDAEAALRVAVAMGDPRFLQPALRHADSTSASVRARAITLLGTIGGRAEAAIVSQQLGDESPEVRAAAVRALGRMRHWPRAPDIARLMRDASWDVRRAAGLALRELGSPGLIMLRKMTRDANHFAADMARQVLDLPASVNRAIS